MVTGRHVDGGSTGEPRLVASMLSVEGAQVVRVDDENHPEFWLEVRIGQEEETHPADSGELEAMGFEWSDDGESMWAKVCPNGPQVVCRVDSDMAATSVGLYWRCGDKQSAQYPIRDDPTAAQVAALLRALRGE